MADKIMLVEDDTNLSEIYQARLEAEGFAIISAKDGEEALALAVKEHPDLIIADIMMPKISGFDMLDILRGTDGIKNTKVIIMTALGQAEDKARADKLGADAYLVKSQVTLEDVVKTVHEVLDGDQGPSELFTEPATAKPADSPAPKDDSPTDKASADATATVPSQPVDNAIADDVKDDQTTTDEQAKMDSQIQSFVDKPAADTPPVTDTPAPQDSNDDTNSLPVTSEPTNSTNSAPVVATASKIINDIIPPPQH